MSIVVRWLEYTPYVCTVAGDVFMLKQTPPMISSAGFRYILAIGCQIPKNNGSGKLMGRNKGRSENHIQHTNLFDFLAIFFVAFSVIQCVAGEELRDNPLFYSY